MQLPTIKNIKDSFENNIAYHFRAHESSPSYRHASSKDFSSQIYKQIFSCNMMVDGFNTAHANATIRPSLKKWPKVVFGVVKLTIGTGVSLLGTVKNVAGAILGTGKSAIQAGATSAASLLAKKPKVEIKE
jgi:hypothetical protein